MSRDLLALGLLVFSVNSLFVQCAVLAERVARALFRESVRVRSRVQDVAPALCLILVAYSYGRAAAVDVLEGSRVRVPALCWEFCILHLGC